jgi:hypothetical protein
VDFTLDAHTEEFRLELSRWNARRTDRRGRVSAFDGAAWRDFLKWKIVGPASGGSILDTAVWYMEVARGGLPGPVLEADLALAAGSADAQSKLADGAVVTSAPPGPTGDCLVGWGAAADLVIDQSNGTVATRGPLRAARLAYPVPHGWYRRTSDAVDDPLVERRWILGAALIAGLARGALDLTSEYVTHRVQFGKTLAQFQAVQFPLAECLVLVEGTSLAVLDAAWRESIGRPRAHVSAAIACLAANRTAKLVESSCHQAFGSLGFCNETGLVGLTWAMNWLRLSIGIQNARGCLKQAFATDGQRPPHQVLEAFAAGSGGPLRPTDSQVPLVRESIAVGPEKA